jgi:probable rRNA maturation factor
MTRDDMGERVTVSNRQRRWKIDTGLLTRIAGRALDLTGGKRAQLGIILVDDGAIARLNTQYHHTQGPTDVLSFDYGEGQRELVISVDRAVAQARRFHSTPARELVLYVVHGILHLHGYDDLAAGDRRRMRTAERRLLANLAKNCGFRGLIGRRVG